MRKNPVLFALIIFGAGYLLLTLWQRERAAAGHTAPIGSGLLSSLLKKLNGLPPWAKVGIDAVFPPALLTGFGLGAAYDYTKTGVEDVGSGIKTATLATGGFFSDVGSEVAGWF